MSSSLTKLISIHGAPRSGTSWLGQIFDSSPDVRYKFQPLYSYAFRNTLNWSSEKQELIDFFTKLYETEDNYLDQIDKKEKGSYPLFDFKKNQPEFLVTKMVRHHYLIPLFLKELREMKVIGIVRNPCAAMVSWKNAPREFWPEWSFDNEWYYAQSRNGFQPGEYYGFHKWKETAKLFLELEKKYPGRFILIRYEDLVKDPISVTKNLFQSVDLPFNQQTEKFIEESTLKVNDDVYSVFKGKKKIDDWVGKLDSKIVGTIYNELKGTELEAFLI